MTHKTERIHALDALRAIMMIFGLVIHSALTYNVTIHGDTWLIKDPNSTNILTDFIVFFIHLFRMPIFFFIAGFFGALLFYERRTLQMVKNRVSRILIPFIIFLFLLWPIIMFVFGYTNAIFSQKNHPIEIALQPFEDIGAFLPKSTLHLWFLYYLVLITGTTVVFESFLAKAQKTSNLTTKIFKWIIQRPLVRILFFSSITFLILTILNTSMMDGSVSLIPDIRTFIYYLFFYLIGWFLFKSKQLLDSFIQYDWTCTILAIILTIIQGLLIYKLELSPSSNSWVLILCSSLVICLFLFGITGLFIRYGSKKSKVLRYISDASYWVYLIHLPFTALIPSFIWKLPITTLEKYLIVLFSTTTICFVSYNYLVRNTFIGKLLNGRKYPRKII